MTQSPGSQMAGAVPSLLLVLRHSSVHVHASQQPPLTTKPLNMNISESASIVPVEQVVQAMREGADDLTAVSPHPRASIMVGVDAEHVRGLQLRVIRLAQKQLDLVDPADTESLARQERDQGKKATLIAEKLNRRAEQGQLTPQQYYEQCDLSPNKQLTRRMFGRPTISNDVLSDEGMVVERRRHASVPMLNSPSSHQLRAKVLSLAGIEAATLQLIGSNTPDDLVNRWVHQTCVLKVNDVEAFYTLCIAMGEDAEIAITTSASVTFKADARCTDELKLSLISIDNEEAVRRLANDHGRMRSSGLFDDLDAAASAPGAMRTSIEAPCDEPRRFTP